MRLEGQRRERGDLVEDHETHVRAVEWRTGMGDGIVEWVPQTNNGPREHLQVLCELVKDMADGHGTPCLINALCSAIDPWWTTTDEKRLDSLLRYCDPGEEHWDPVEIRPTHVDDFLDHGTDPEHLTDAQIDALFWLDRLAGQRREDHAADAREMLREATP